MTATTAGSKGRRDVARLAVRLDLAPGARRLWKPSRRRSCTRRPYEAMLKLGSRPGRRPLNCVSRHRTAAASLDASAGAKRSFRLAVGSSSWLPVAACAEQDTDSGTPGPRPWYARSLAAQPARPPDRQAAAPGWNVRGNRSSARADEFDVARNVNRLTARRRVADWVQVQPSSRGSCARARPPGQPRSTILGPHSGTQSSSLSPSSSLGPSSSATATVAFHQGPPLDVAVEQPHQ